MTFFNIQLIEWIGYIGSVMVAVSLTMSSIKKLRWYNLMGATVFSFYGFSIGSLPVGLLNLFIVLTNIFYLIKMFSAKEAFKSVLVSPQSQYLAYFIDFYKQEIHNFFPEFNKNILADDEINKKLFPLLLLRNASVAGVFLGSLNNNTLYVYLDFVTAQYRDLKPGEFIYNQNTDYLKSNGIQKIVCNTDNKHHQKYLLRMGFKPLTTSTNGYLKEL